MIDMKKFSGIKKVYRFFGKEDYNFKGLEKSYLWCSKVDDFNDPLENTLTNSNFNISKLNNEELVLFFESNPGIELVDSESEKVIKLKDLDLHKLFEHRGAEITQTLNEIIIAHAEMIQVKKFHCLSHDNGGEHPLESKLLWAHYASGLRGFAIEFDIDFLLNSLSENNEGVFLGCGLMTYSDKDYISIVKEKIKNNDWLDIMDLLFNKLPEWSYEKELRIISEKNEINYDPQIISKLIIGEKISDENKDKIIEFATTHNITERLFLAKVNNQKRSIEVVNFGK
ncbi:DUF2971 domain-containing protein [Vibrio parahaemolyticus]|nr:DUF2971 domain-containing protein [Vibrio parahaemolyticus]EHR7287294.1 DUF2971 domain-containing protein [Vibrio parahaemolyticus]EJL7824585.1 DUF2971 domain-containing protein [Vibrio parahaemolyticus]EJM7150430.1 DUF2971 domain-containing protein [Vibrio parahaemolyticus]